MRSINTLVGTALLGASLVLAGPAVGHAAPARPQVDPADCAKAVAAAAKAQLQYDAAVAEYGKDAAAAGGKPDKSRQEQLDRAKHEFDAAASATAKACPEVGSAGGKSGAGDKTGSGEKAATTESGHDKDGEDSAEDTPGSTGGYQDGRAAAPSGSMHTGAGGTSTGAGGSEVALGAGLFAAGAGVLVLRRRRRRAAGRI
ncbi:hypothetical protein [Embleya sp. NPDC001921]